VGTEPGVSARRLGKWGALLYRRRTLLAAGTLAVLAVLCLALFMKWPPAGTARLDGGPLRAATAPAMQPAVAGPAATVAVIWRAGDGSLHRVPVNRSALTSFIAGRNAALEAERERLVALGAAMASTAGSLTFAEVKQHVPRYVDWAYGWLSSYVMSYQVLYETVRTVYGDARDGWPMPISEAIGQGLGNFARRRFHEIVVQPVLDDRTLLRESEQIAALESEWKHVVDANFDAWQSFLTTRSGKWETLPQDAVPRADAPDTMLLDLAPARMTPLLTDRTALDMRAPITQLDDIRDDRYRVLIRATRPFVARLAVLVLHVTVATPVAIGAAIGFGLGGFPGAAIGYGIVLTGVWGADFAINRVDRALHRGQFEAEVLDAVGAVERGSIAAATLRIRNAIEHAIGDLKLCDERGCRGPIG
jgi:hypothetical protein